MTENEIAKIVIDAAFQIHKRLGSGLLESVYEIALAYGFSRKESSGCEGNKEVQILHTSITSDRLRIDFG